MYHSHFNSTEPVGKGLYGAFFVQPKADDWGSLYGTDIAVEHTMFLGDGPTGFVLNGKEFPATQPIVATLVDKRPDPPVERRFRRSIRCTSTATTSRSSRRTGSCSILRSGTWRIRWPIAPGQRLDILVKAEYPGVWAYRCHILPHEEGPYGMVTAMIVQ